MGGGMMHEVVFVKEINQEQRGRGSQKQCSSRLRRTDEELSEVAGVH